MGIWTFVGGAQWEGGEFRPNKGIGYELPREENRTIRLDGHDILFPGFVDAHAHLWAPGASKLGHICAQQLASSGIVAALDFGSYGYDGWEAADRFWRATSPLVTRSFLNICPEGQPGAGARTPAKDISKQRLVDMYRRAEGRLLGFKVHLGFGAAGVDDDREWLRLIREVADAAEARIGVHLTLTYLEMREIASYLKSGDILIHVAQGKRGAPLDADGSYSEAVVEAQKRGVLMDCATGLGNFSWDIFRKAKAKGFQPDLYANDMTFNSWQDGVHRDMPHLISSLSAIGGVPLEDLFTAVTTRAAALMGIEYSFDSLAVLRRKNIALTVTDSLQQTECADYAYELDAFLRDGACWIDKLGG